MKSLVPNVGLPRIKSDKSKLDVCVCGSTLIEIEIEEGPSQSACDCFFEQAKL